MNHRNLAYTAMADRANRRNPADPIVIGICAPKGSGKSTFAQMMVNFLLENRGNVHVDIKRAPFAGPLKYACLELFGISPCTPQEDKGVAVQTPAGPRTPRHVWQTFGVMMRETFGEDFWVERLYQDAFYGLDCPVIAIVDDVRFENEARTIRERGGLVVGLKRPGFFEQARGGHISERQMYEQWGSMVDFEVLNYGDIVDLRGIACEVAAGAFLGCSELKIEKEEA